MTQLTPDDEQRLKALNDAVDTAMAERKAWLDSKMEEYAVVPIGQDIYNLDTGERLGTVISFYRYMQDQHDGAYDRSLHIDYRFYKHDRRRVDNTSRHGGALRVGTKEEAILEMEQRLAWARKRLLWASEPVEVQP